MKSVNHLDRLLPHNAQSSVHPGFLRLLAWRDQPLARLRPSPGGCQQELQRAAYSGKSRRRKEILSCFPLFLPAKNAVFQEAVLALMRVAEVCVSSPWFPAYLAAPCCYLFLLPPVLSTQPAGFDFLGHIPFFC